MSAILETGSPSVPVRGAAPAASLDKEGMIAGVLGAGAIALFLFAVDLAHGRPLFTPTVLGTAIFRGGRGLDSPETLAISGEMVLLFTWVHALAFAAIGGVAARLLAMIERDAHLGFGIVLLFVGLELGFVFASLMVAEPVLELLPWWAVLGGNVLAAGVMLAYFARRHPRLVILP